MRVLLLQNITTNLLIKDSSLTGAAELSGSFSDVVFDRTVLTNALGSILGVTYR
jgi:hypothetical protein